MRPNAAELKATIITAAQTLPEPLPLAIVVALADRVAERLAHPAPLSRAERDAAIRKEWNTRNLAELTRKYQISRTTLYRIIGKI